MAAQRRRAAYKAMEALLEADALPGVAELAEACKPLSGEELLQARSLADPCVAIAALRPPAPRRPPAGRRRPPLADPHAQAPSLQTHHHHHQHHQVAEERALAGRCGNPLCAAAVCRPAAARDRFRAAADNVHRVAPPTYCGAACELTVSRFAAQLGDPSSRMRPDVVSRILAQTAGACVRARARLRACV